MHLFERNEIDHVLMTEEFTFCEVDPPWLFGGWSVGGPGGGAEGFMGVCSACGWSRGIWDWLV